MNANSAIDRAPNEPHLVNGDSAMIETTCARAGIDASENRVRPYPDGHLVIDSAQPVLLRGLGETMR
jgi:hypothetical protein